jgi:hypothetical protein
MGKRFEPENSRKQSSCATASKAKPRTLLTQDIDRTSKFMMVLVHKILTPRSRSIKIFLSLSVLEAAFFVVVISANTSEQKWLK